MKNTFTQFQVTVLLLIIGTLLIPNIGHAQIKDKQVHTVAPLPELSLDTTRIVEVVLKDTLIIAGVGDIMLGTNFPNSSYLRSEEHTSELQSRPHLVCRLL